MYVDPARLTSKHGEQGKLIRGGARFKPAQKFLGAFTLPRKIKTTVIG